IFPRPNQPAGELFGMDSGAEAVFTANQALATLLRTLGIRPHAMAGHSTGEHSALLMSGTVTVADDRELIAHVRGVNAIFERQQEQIPDAVLLATGGVPMNVLRDLAGGTNGAVHIAMDNCPHQVVLCGTEAGIAGIDDALRDRAAICQRLPFGRAYHTPRFEPFCDAMRAYFAGVPIVPAKSIDVYSCVTAVKHSDDADAI